MSQATSSRLMRPAAAAAAAAVKPKARKGRARVSVEQSALEAELTTLVGLPKCKEPFRAVQALLRRNPQAPREQMHLFLSGDGGLGRKSFARLYSQLVMRAGASQLPRLLSGARLSLMEDRVLKQENGKTSGVLIVSRVESCSTRVLAHLDSLRADGIVLILIGNRAQLLEFVEGEHPERAMAAVDLLQHFSASHQSHCRNHNEQELLSLCEQIRRRQYPQHRWSAAAMMCLRMRLKSVAQGQGEKKNRFAVCDVLFESVKRCATRMLGVEAGSAAPSSGAAAATAASSTPRVLAVDLLGRELGAVHLQSCTEWVEFQKLCGLQDAQDAITRLVDETVASYESQLAGSKPLPVPLHACIVGGAGVGKLTVARAYAAVLAHFELVASAEVVEGSVFDLIGGEHRLADKNTRRLLGQAEGRVLVLRDLCEPAGSRDSQAEYTTVLRLLRAHLKAARGVVLTVGRPSTLEQYFQSDDANWDDCELFGWTERRITCHSHSQEDLLSVLVGTLSNHAVYMSPEARAECTGQLVRLSKRPYFADAKSVVHWANALLRQCRHRGALRGAESQDMEIDGSDALARAQSMDDSESEEGADGPLQPVTLQLADVLPSDVPARSVKALFAQAGLRGCDDLIARLQSLFDAALYARLSGAAEPYAHIPMTFAFVGPPGTGKTSVARIVGELFRAIGLVQHGGVVESSASDLIDGYIGRTAAKTTRVLRRCRGRVLFLDEAYQLNPRRTQHSYVGEALDEIVKALTSAELSRQFVLILAGYQPDIEALMQQNPGLGSRFPDHVHFRPFTVEVCWSILRARLDKLGLKHAWGEDDAKAQGIAAAASAPNKPAAAAADAAIPPCLRALLYELSVTHTRDWGNARDLNTIATRLHNRLGAAVGAAHRSAYAVAHAGQSVSVLSSAPMRAGSLPPLPVLDEGMLLDELRTMLHEVEIRARTRLQQPTSS